MHAQRILLVTVRNLATITIHTTLPSTTIKARMVWHLEANEILIQVHGMVTVFLCQDVSSCLTLFAALARPDPYWTLLTGSGHTRAHCVPGSSLLVSHNNGYHWLWRYSACDQCRAGSHAVCPDHRRLVLRHPVGVHHKSVAGEHTSHLCMPMLDALPNNSSPHACGSFLANHDVFACLRVVPCQFLTKRELLLPD